MSVRAPSEHRLVGMATEHDDPPERLLARVCSTARALGLSVRTERAYRSWIIRFVRFSGLRHPCTLGVEETRRFLESLSTTRKVGAGALNQAHAALAFLYRDVLHEPARCAASVPHARRSGPADALTPDEARRILAHVAPARRLAASLLYGAGLSLMECVTLRVADVDLARSRIHVRDARGGMGRFTMLPEALRDALVEQIEAVRRQHLRDVQCGGGFVPLPATPERPNPHATREWRMAWLFPAARQHVDRATRQRRRCHVFGTTLQRAVRGAARRAGVTKRVTPRVLRHSFAAHLLRMGAEVGTVQGLVGHRDVATTLGWVRAIDAANVRVRSPLDDPTTGG